MGFISRDYESLEMHPSPPTVPDAEPVHVPSLAEMVERTLARRPKSGSDALRELRAAFPDTPLRLRIEALNVLMRRPGSR